MGRERKQIPFWVWIVVVIFLCFLCSQYCFQLTLIQGDSMAPTYHNLELAVLTKLSRSYVPGDVIVFQCDGLDSILVKRIAAGPGSTVEIRNGYLMVDGEPSALYSDVQILNPGIAQNRIVLGENEFFALGDNLAASKDSRSPEVGVIHSDTIRGKILQKKN